MAKRSPLHCWLGDVHVADFTSKRGWDLSCRYTAEALDCWPGNLPVLSCSLPLQARRLDASAFLRGLLPEGAHLQAMAALAGVAANDTYALLARFGRDVAGALVISAEEGPPDQSRWGVEPYSAAQFEREIVDLGAGLGARDDSELSLAGFQNKLLLVNLGPGWARPVRGQPSTHILKVDHDRFGGLVAAEYAALRLARELGLGDLDPQLVAVGGIECLIVRRFDRSEAEGRVARIHQEDVCQALGVRHDRERGRGKYEAHGGPSFAQLAGVLSGRAAEPAAELDRLVRVVAFTSIVGNADAHGKNLSLLYPEVGVPTLAPLYDTVPTALWSQLRSRAAMSVHGITNFDGITVDAIADEAASWGHSRARSSELVRSVAEQAIDYVSDLGHEAVQELVMANSTKLLSD
ncbi:MAG: HipA domain-containing protein [Microthrixaceae bacterium]